MILRTRPLLRWIFRKSRYLLIWALLCLHCRGRSFVTQNDGVIWSWRASWTPADQLSTTYHNDRTIYEYNLAARGSLSQPGSNITGWYGRREMSTWVIILFWCPLEDGGHEARGGGKGTPGNSWWGCATQFSKSWPYFRPKNEIFHTGYQTISTSKIHTRFQSWPLGRNYVIIS